MQPNYYQEKHQANKIDISDRGLAYGDGLFETIAVIDGSLHHWSLHWQRLMTGATRLSIHLPNEQELLAHIQTEMNDALDTSLQGVVKIIITRGSGGRGYQFPQQQRENVIISCHDWPEREVSDYEIGIDVMVCQTNLSKQPALSGIKHLNRLEQVLARNEFHHADYQEGIMLAYSANKISDNTSYDYRNPMTQLVIEGTSSNLFFVIDSVLCTPRIEACGVLGTMRQAIISFASACQSVSVQEGNFSLQQLAQATEVFFTNSIYGILPVASIRVNESLQWFYNERHISTQLAEQFNSQLKRPGFV